MAILNAFENCYVAFYLNNGRNFFLSFGDIRKLLNFIVRNF